MVKLLKLMRPLAILDFETTGRLPKVDRIVQIGILKIQPTGKTTRFLCLVNPEMRIPPEATEVHKISDSHVRNRARFQEIAPKIDRILSGCDLAGYNFLKFDRQVLKEEFTRADVAFDWGDRYFIDPFVIFRSREPRERLTLANACKFYCGREHVNPHNALEDASVCYNVLEAQLAKYPDLARHTRLLHEYCCRPFGGYLDWAGKFEWRYRKVAFTFGKYAGKTLKDVVTDDPDYLKWMLREFDHLPDTKQIVQKALKGKFPKRPS